MSSRVWTLGWQGKGEWRFATRYELGSWTWTEFENDIKWFSTEAEAKEFVDDERTKVLSKKEVQNILAERSRQQEEDL